MRFVTPLRYPGGKAKLWKYIADVVAKNGCMNGHYVEPYAGGAGIALQLLNHEYVRYVHLNDLNRSVYSFWHTVLNNTDELCERISKCKLTIAEWRRQREIQRNPNGQTKMDLAFSLFYLNRTNRSGIIAGGGVIGGLDQAGPWKLDARFNKEDLIERIRTVATYKSRIHLNNMDAERFLLKKNAELGADALFYLDPPYYEKASRLYDNFYHHDDHVRLASFVGKTLKKKKWLVSYDNVANISDIYGKYPQIQYGLSYSAKEYRVGSELMIFSPSIQTDDLEYELTAA